MSAFLILYFLQRATSCPLCSPERPRSYGECQRGVFFCRFQYLEALRGSTRRVLKRRGRSSPHAHGRPLFRIFPCGAPLLNLNVEGDAELFAQRQPGLCKAGGCTARQNGNFKQPDRFVGLDQIAVFVQLIVTGIVDEIFPARRRVVLSGDPLAARLCTAAADGLSDFIRNGCAVNVNVRCLVDRVSDSIHDPVLLFRVACLPFGDYIVPL